MNSTLINVITDNVENNPHCFHGPSLLFRKIHGKNKEYYACSACRDRKDCNFYVPAENLNKDSTIKLSKFWQEEQKSTVNALKKNNSHSRLLKILNELNKSLKKNQELSETLTSKLNYCYTCSCLFIKSETKHSDCNVLLNLSKYQLTHPTEILVPKTNSKTHAQYFFSPETVNDILLLLSRLSVTKVLCIGVPRIHESILNSPEKSIKSLLLDFDRNYYNFYSKNEFIWFNMFNNHVFDCEQKEVLKAYLCSGKILVLLDPPFGGRVEPLACMLKLMSHLLRNINNEDDSFVMDTFWFFPYFMEQHIIQSLPKFRMFDYKVNYENHTVFTNVGNRKRKFGSPVRIFTNVDLRLLNLNGVAGYKFCESCEYWVSDENKHCEECESCTSKDGRTYVHCRKCRKCVKPSYEHCEKCGRCCLSNHVCGQFQPDLTCYHCHEAGHKKNSCPAITSQTKNHPLRSDIGKRRGKKMKIHHI